MWAFEITKITVNKDRLVEIDTENFEVDKFKRASVSVNFADEGSQIPMKLHLSLRGGTLTISSPEREAPVGKYGMAIVTQWQLAIGEQRWEVIENIMQARGEAHIQIKDPESLLTYLHDLKELGMVVPHWQG